MLTVRSDIIQRKVLGLATTHPRVLVSFMTFQKIPLQKDKNF